MNRTSAPAIVIVGNVSEDLTPEGAWFYRKGARAALPAFATRAVDPTGAGDGFAAALAIRLAETGDLLEACTFANAMGSLMVERRGPQDAPSREDVERRRQRRVADGA